MERDHVIIVVPASGTVDGPYKPMYRLRQINDPASGTLVIGM